MVCYLHKGRHRSVELNREFRNRPTLTIDAQLMFDKVQNNSRVRIVFSTNGTGKTIKTWRENEPQHAISCYTKKLTHLLSKHEG